MKPELQRIAIATACGWKPCTRCDDPECAYNQPPDYCGSLDAMATAERSLTDEDAWQMAVLLSGCVMRPGDIPLLCRSETIKLMHATAAQRAESFLRVKCLWQEGEPS